MLTAPRVSKRKYQQHGTPANQKFGHERKPKTTAQQQAADAAAEAFNVGQARIADIGVNPKYLNGSHHRKHVAVVSWLERAKQWNADHDVVTPPKVEARTSKRRRKAPRAAATYRAERRNAAPKVVRQPDLSKPTHTWPQPDFAKLAAKVRHARRTSIAA